MESEEDAMNAMNRQEQPVTQTRAESNDTTGHLKSNGGGENGEVVGESEAIDVPLRPEEKKRLDWRGELYLAPLTTVGNLVRCYFAY